MSLEPKDRNVFVLGAGFSKDAGAPLIHDFLDQARAFVDDPSSSLNQQERDRFARVFEFRRNVAQAGEKVRIDLDNIEQLFGLAEIAEKLEVGAATIDIRRSTTYLVAKTLQIATSQQSRPWMVVNVSPNTAQRLQDRRLFEETFESNSDYRTVRVDMYKYFAALIGGLLDDEHKGRNRRNSVITFNYDLVVERSLTDIGLEPEYHFDSGLGGVGDGNYPKKVSVFKLHGSAGAPWASSSARTNQQPLVP